MSTCGYNDCGFCYHPESTLNGNCVGRLRAACPLNKGEGCKVDSDGKNDQGKPNLHLLHSGFPRVLWALAEVLSFGAEKYSANGWQKVPNGRERYQAAAGRHQAQRFMGTEKDDESGLWHEAHELTSRLMAFELFLKEKE
jgi:hypothetical protein